MRSTLRILLPLLVVALAAYFFRTPVRLAWLAITGHGTACPISQAVKAAANVKRQAELNERIVRASRLIEKDPAGFHLWATPDGRYWMPAGSDYALSWDLAEQERKIYGTGERDVHPGDIVLDCGANVGVFTRRALAAGAKLVVAIEIAPENLECLRRNFADEILGGRVIVYPKGVWDKDDFLTLNVDSQNSAADSVVMNPEKAHPGPRVPLTTIDKIAGELHLPRVDFIKMDIEGAEQRALAGARETLARFHSRLSLSAYHLPDDPQKIPELVRSAWSGYRMECGPCQEGKTSDGQPLLRPDVLYFY